jgi:hypothetical protein
MGGAGTAHARQRTLEASVAWSYDLLDDAPQSALRHLSTFAGPFDLDAAAEVVDVPGADVVELVASLVDKSLLTEEPADGTTRYRMLETVRFYARDRCVQSGEATACRERHLGWVRTTVDRCADAFEGVGAGAAVRSIDRSVEEIRAAMEWALSSGRALDTLAIAAALGWYWVWRGLAGEGGRWLEHAESALDEQGVEPDPGLAARAGWAWHQVVTHRLQTHEEVERVAVAAIAAAVAAGDAASRLAAGCGSAPTTASTIPSPTGPRWRRRHRCAATTADPSGRRWPTGTWPRPRCSAFGSVRRSNRLPRLSAPRCFSVTTS